MKFPLTPVAVGMAFLALAIAVSACSTQVIVNEQTQDRSHAFTALSDGTKIYLKGALSIDGKEYPAEFYYDADQAILLRKNPEQCIRFGPDKVLFGFLPPWDKRAEILEKNSEGMPLRYRIMTEEGEESEIVIEKPSAKEFTFDTKRECMTEDDYIHNVQ